MRFITQVSMGLATSLRLFIFAGCNPPSAQDDGRDGHGHHHHHEEPAAHGGYVTEPFRERTLKLMLKRFNVKWLIDGKAHLQAK